MKLKERICNPYGLRARLGLSLVVSSAICILVFVIMNTTISFLLSNYYEHSDFERIHKQRQHESLQNFIDTHSISSQNISAIKKWEKRQPIVLIELFSGDSCIYSSIYDVPVSSLMLDSVETGREYRTLQLADGLVIAFIYSDFLYRYNELGMTVSIFTALVLFILLFLHNTTKLIRYICRLNDEVQILEGGNLEYCVSEEGNDELADLARSMNRMRVALQHQLDSEQQLYQSHRQLITEMSHDLRTPLTGILLYLEILRTHHYESEEQLQDYLQKIDTKAHHLKSLSDHLFEYALRGVPKKQIEPSNMEKAFSSAVRGFEDDLKARGFMVVTDLVWENCYVQVNPEYIHRIFENLVSNIEKYAERKAEVRIDVVKSGSSCGFSIMNSFSSEMSLVESNGVGVESIHTMMKEMNGICAVEQTDATFEITLLFPKQ